MTTNKVTNSILIVCALAITALVVRRELFSKLEPPGVGMRIITNWNEVLDGGHLLYGRHDAPVKIVEFGDFQCGACAEAGSELRQLYGRHPDFVAVIYRHYPLQSLHEYAYMAAVASECAADQGVFQGYHDVLFENHERIGRLSWTELAARAGVRDTIRFRDCLGDSLAHERVAKDTALAYHLGVRATPTFVINGNVLSATPARERWDQLVKGLARKSSAQTAVKR